MLKEDYEEYCESLYQAYQECVEDWLELDPSVADISFEEYLMLYYEDSDNSEGSRCVEIKLA